MSCAICDQVGGPLPSCSTCGLPKAPVGRSVAAAAAGGYCDYECPGYRLEPVSGALWPGERWGDSIGHADWHEAE